MVDVEKTVLARLAKILDMDAEKHDRVQIMQSATMKIESLKATNFSIREELKGVYADLHMHEAWHRTYKEETERVQSNIAEPEVVSDLDSIDAKTGIVLDVKYKEPEVTPTKRKRTRK